MGRPPTHRRPRQIRGSGLLTAAAGCSTLPGGGVSEGETLLPTDGVGSSVALFEL